MSPWCRTTRKSKNVVNVPAFVHTVDGPEIDQRTRDSSCTTAVESDGGPSGGPHPAPAVRTPRPRTGRRAPPSPRRERRTTRRRTAVPCRHRPRSRRDCDVSRERGNGPIDTRPRQRYPACVPAAGSGAHRSWPRIWPTMLPASAVPGGPPAPRIQPLTLRVGRSRTDHRTGHRQAMYASSEHRMIRYPAPRVGLNENGLIRCGVAGQQVSAPRTREPPVA